MPTRVQIPSPAISLVKALPKTGISSNYKLALKSGLARFSNKRVYKNSKELIAELEKKREKICQDRYMGIALRIAIHKLAEEEIVSPIELIKAKKFIRVKKVGTDNYVPTTREVQETLARLPKHKQEIYNFILYSGLRLTELEYILEQRRTLEVQDLGSFYKIMLNYSRGQKKCFFCYIPKPQWEAIQQCNPKTLPRTKHFLHNHKLVHMKYLRKYFYTTAIGTGCPSEVADFIQGRVSNTIGGRHYLAVQRLADEWYPRVVASISF